MYDIAFLLVIFSPSIAVGRGRLMFDVPKYSAGKHSCLGVNSFDNHGLINVHHCSGSPLCLAKQKRFHYIKIPLQYYIKFVL